MKILAFWGLMSHLFPPIHQKSSVPSPDLGSVILLNIQYTPETVSKRWKHLLFGIELINIYWFLPQIINLTRDRRYYYRDKGRSGYLQVLQYYILSRDGEGYYYEIKVDQDTSRFSSIKYYLGMEEDTITR